MYGPEGHVPLISMAVVRNPAEGVIRVLGSRGCGAFRLIIATAVAGTGRSTPRDLSSTGGCRVESSTGKYLIIGDFCV
ncbi:hypothetical protein [Agromyces sp. NPDC055661]